MGHNDYVRRDGQWGGNPVLVPRDMQRFDQAQAESLNLDDGGTWAPSAPIILGGAGLTLSGSSPHVLSGGVKTGPGGRIFLGHNDFVGFASNRTRTLLVPIVGVHTDIADAGLFDVSMDPVGIKFLQNQPSTAIQWTVPQRYLHHGATLTGVSMTMRVGAPHNGVPGTQLPRFGLTRWHRGHATIDVVAAGNMAAPGSGTAYFASGNAQVITGVISGPADVDVGLYTYTVEIFDEFGTNALPGNIYTSMTFTYGAIADMHFE